MCQHIDKVDDDRRKPVFRIGIDILLDAPAELRVENFDILRLGFQLNLAALEQVLEELVLVSVPAVVVVLPLFPDLREPDFNLVRKGAAENRVAGVRRRRRKNGVIIIAGDIEIFAQHRFHGHPLVEAEAIGHEEEDLPIGRKLGYEILLDDAIRLTRSAGMAGADATAFIAAGMQHVFPIWAGAFPEADAAIALIGEWVRMRTGKLMADR